MVAEAGVLSALLALAAAPVRADDKTAAREHWERGTKFYDLGKYDDAIREFEAAYEAKSDPAFLYNLAQSHRLAGHNADALRFYRTYLRYVPKAPNRGDIEEQIKTLEKSGAADHPAVEPPPTAPPPPLPEAGFPSAVGGPAAGGPPAGASPASALPAQGGANAGWPPPPATSATNTAAPGSSTGATPEVAPPSTSEPTATPQTSGHRTLGTVLAISGGGLFVVGAVFGLVARSQSKKVEDAAANNATFDPSVERLGKTSQTLQWVGYGLGVAAMAAGVVLYVNSRTPADQTSTPGRVAVAPVVGRDLGGASLRVTF
jgi:tetratricopeptide (TPR) repeat protein